MSMKEKIITILLGIFVALMWWGVIYFYVLGHENISQLDKGDKRAYWNIGKNR